MFLQASSEVKRSTAVRGKEVDEGEEKDGEFMKDGKEALASLYLV